MTADAGGRKVPGAGATSVLGYELWNGLFTALSRGRSRLKLAWFHARASRAQTRAPPGALWPLPVPFPELHRKGANRGQKDASRKLGLNYCVIVLNYLHGSERHWKSVIPPLGTPLNGSQWDLVQRLRRQVDVWNAEAVVTSAEMGRSATKVESLEDVLNQLQAEAELVHSGLKSYGSKAEERLRTDWGMKGAPGSVVGKLDVAPAHPAKALEPDRLQFWGEPSFDPRPFMDPANVSMFEFPLQHAIDPAELPERPPRVRVRCPPTQRLAFLRKLDSCKRLALRPTRTIREGFQNGVFAIPKDEQRDRMVLDARPPNALEQSEQRWIKSLAGLHQLQHFFLQEDECLYLFAEDLREFYHAFVISEERILRNALKMSFRPWELKALECFSHRLLREKSVTPCLKTMAMGDTNAVAFGQASHLGVLLQSGALELDHFITLLGRPPRQRWLAGLMIDDLVLLEARPDQATEETEAGAAQAELDCSQRIRQVREQYEKVRLPRHSGKAVFNETKGSFWGVQMDGVAGDLRPNLKRSIPLSHIILRVLNLGCCTVALLEVIAGSLVSIFSLRRRFMSVLQEIYEAQKNRQRNEIVRLSPELQDELCCSLALVSLTHLDMRLRPSDYLVASDASSTAEGAVATKIGQKATEELQRHALQKGLWNRLVSPAQAYLREKGIEDLEACELPEGEYDMHPLWQEIVETQEFALFGAVKKVRKQRHINLGEISAALQAEVEQGKKQPDSFYLHLQDSQVSLAALTKGRSSSRSVNALIRQSIPDAIAYNNRAFYGYVRSRLNPADDPTRDVVIRAPVRTEAEWLTDLKAGEYEKLEAALAEWDLTISALRQLPDESELLAPAPVDKRTGLEARKQRRKDRRKHAAEVKAKAAEAVQHEVEERQACSLSEEALALLRSFPEDQFIWHQKFASLEDALQSGAGVLDLFSGSRGFARACAKMAETWVLTFDIAHNVNEDLLQGPLQSKITKLLRLKAFRAMGAAPVCCSFSTAITPPCRSKQHPDGVPWCSEKQKVKNELGNEMLRFVLSLIPICLAFGVIFFVENPDGSWMWRQRGSLAWDPVLGTGKIGDLRLDYCRFGTRWRKRTRFRTNSHLKGQRVFCRCNKPHIQLRGKCKHTGVNFTKLAEPYPRQVCFALASGLLRDAGFLGKCGKVDVAACAKVTHARIGEASNPGPRRGVPDRAPEDLARAELLEPATIAVRHRMLTQFFDWFDSNCGGACFVEWSARVPGLAVSALVAFGHHCFAASVPLHYYRQLLAHFQKIHLQLRPFMAIAWQLVTKWELLEPVQHRAPLPEPLLQAMTTLGIAWKWDRWAAALLGCFYAICRIGEFLSAQRKDILTPHDLLCEDDVIYVRILLPKTRRRGASTQYATISEPSVVRFLVSVWQELQPNDLLYGGSPSAFRRRWDATLTKIGVGPQHRLTPGSLRGGGAVSCHRRGMPIADLLWRMRLQNVKTLSFYLQETTAMSILPALQPSVRQRVQLLRDLLPLFLAQRGPAAHSRAPKFST